MLLLQWQSALLGRPEQEEPCWSLLAVEQQSACTYKPDANPPIHVLQKGLITVA